jgi:ribosome-associated heat shock protein Hsp15
VTATPESWERLDVWLWYARVAKTRSLCARAVQDGGFRLNRQPTDKPHAKLRVGDVLTLCVTSFTSFTSMLIF